MYVNLKDFPETWCIFLGVGPCNERPFLLAFKKSGSLHNYCIVGLFEGKSLRTSPEFSSFGRWTSTWRERWQDGKGNGKICWFFESGFFSQDGKILGQMRMVKHVKWTKAMNVFFGRSLGEDGSHSAKAFMNWDVARSPDSYVLNPTGFRKILSINNTFHLRKNSHIQSYFASVEVAVEPKIPSNPWRCNAFSLPETKSSSGANLLFHLGEIAQDGSTKTTSKGKNCYGGTYHEGRLRLKTEMWDVGLWGFLVGSTFFTTKKRWQ